MAQAGTGKLNRLVSEIKREKISTVHLCVFFLTEKKTLQFFFLFSCHVAIHDAAGFIFVLTAGAKAFYHERKSEESLSLLDN